VIERDFELKSLTVLYLDCQTTGGGPQSSEPLEIGWKKSHLPSEEYRDAERVYSFLLKLPEGSEIPSRVQKVTGISPEDVRNGYEPEAVYAKLLEDAKHIMRFNGLSWCPLVIHYSGFEEPFIRNFHARYGSGRPFPFRFLCTHKLAKKIFPELPRRGLRAVAGYLGFSVGEMRRCTEHVNATEYVWKALLSIIRNKYGILTLQELVRWMDKTAESVPAEKSYPMPQQYLSCLPVGPGIYRMLRQNGDILYIGKAGSIKSRVKSYFHKSRKHPEHILEMLSQAKAVDVRETPSVLEAALLESDEIKRVSPPYNIALKIRPGSPYFYSSDFERVDTAPSFECRLGPFSSRDHAEKLSAMLKLLNTASREIMEKALASALGLLPEYMPDMACMSEGMDLFLDSHGYELACGNTLSAMKNISIKTWLRKKAEKKEMPEEETTEEPSPSWSPEAVCGLLESNIMRGFYEMRRASWLLMLSESSLEWEECGFGKSDRFIMVLEGGSPVCKNIYKKEEIPLPPGYLKNRLERQIGFDAVVMDRMRVLSTEIRKLVSRKCYVRVRLGRTNCLDSLKLGRLFFWI